MPNAVHKYELPIKTEVEVEMPMNAEPFLAQMQDGKLCVWAYVSINPEVTKVKKKFLLLKTGQESNISPERVSYLGTCVLTFGMDLGLHVFQID